MFYPVKVLDSKGKVKKVISSEQLSDIHWDSFYAEWENEAPTKNANELPHQKTEHGTNGNGNGNGNGLHRNSGDNGHANTNGNGRHQKSSANADGNGLHRNGNAHGRSRAGGNRRHRSGSANAGGNGGGHEISEDYHMTH